MKACLLLNYLAVYHVEMELYSCLDYWRKYYVLSVDKLSFSAFHKKLSLKNQSEVLCRQAHAAVVLYHEMLRAKHTPVPSQASVQTQGKESATDRNQTVAATVDKSGNTDYFAVTGASWVSVYDKLNSVIKLRHYFPKILQADRSWIRSFQNGQPLTPFAIASRLLQANCDIRIIQALLGHSNLKTTMIYTHTVQGQSIKQAKSPLDF